MRTLTIVLFAFLISPYIAAQNSCGEHYKSDVPEFFASMGDNYTCSMVQVNRVQKEIVLRCDHVLGSAFVKNLKVSQDYVNEHREVLKSVPMSEGRFEAREQRIFRNAIMLAYKETLCVNEKEIANKDKESIKDKFVAAGESLEKDIELLTGITEIEGHLAEVEVFDGGRHPKPDLEGILNGRIPDEDERSLDVIIR